MMSLADKDTGADGAAHVPLSPRTHAAAALPHHGVGGAGGDAHGAAMAPHRPLRVGYRAARRDPRKAVLRRAGSKRVQTLRTMAPYLPDAVLRRCIEAGARRAEAAGGGKTVRDGAPGIDHSGLYASVDSELGVAAIFDVSGFTALANTLAQPAHKRRSLVGTLGESASDISDATGSVVPPMSPAPTMRARRGLGRLASSAQLRTAAMEARRRRATSESVEESASRGAEELQTILNSFFAALMDIIIAADGDIIRVAGDAVIVVYKQRPDESAASVGRPGTAATILSHAEYLTTTTPQSESTASSAAGGGQQLGSEEADRAGGLEEPLGMTRLVERALSSAHSAVTKLHNTEVLGHRLGLHVGIAAGKLHGHHVGGVRGRWDYIVGGTPLLELADALGGAPSGHIGVCTSAWRYLGLASDGAGGSSTPGRPSDSSPGSVVCLRGIGDFVRASDPESSTVCLRPIVYGEDSSAVQSDAFSGGTAAEAASDAAATGSRLSRPPSFVGSVASGGTAPGGGRATLLRSTQASSAWTEDAVRSYVADPVVSHVALASSGWLGSVRRVTALFLRLRDPGVVCEGTEESLARLQSIFSIIQGVLLRFEAWIKEITLDDKGCVVVALFGVPPMVHDDDAARAVHAALSMVRALRDNDVESYVGIATGVTFCAAVGGIARREFSCIGPSVILAARLMAHRSNQGVLLDSATARTCNDDRLAFGVGTSLCIKGSEADVTAYEPSEVVDVAERRRSSVATPVMFDAGESPTAAGQRPSVSVAGTSRDVHVDSGGRRLMGREREHAQLTNSLHALWRGRQGGIVVIQGDPGCGKSFLVGKGVATARRIGLSVVQSIADPIHTNTPFYPWRPVLEAVLCEPGDAWDSMRVEEAIRQQLPPHLLPFAFVLNDVIPVQFPVPVSPEVSTSRLLDTAVEVVTSLLAAAADDSLTTFTCHERLLVVIDNADWFDQHSLRVLAEINAKCSSSVLVWLVNRSGAATSHGTDAELSLNDVLASGVSVHKIRVGGLPLRDLKKVVAEELGCATIDKPAAAFIHSRSGGNPLFARSLAATLVHDGVLVISDDPPRVSLVEGASVNRSALRMPHSLESAVAAEAARRLSPAAQLTLQVASVLGRTFENRLLEAVHPMDSGVQSDVRQLVRARYLELAPAESMWLARRHRSDATSTSGSSDGLDLGDENCRLRFRSVLVHEVMYHALPHSRRVELHSKAAESLEARVAAARSEAVAIVSAVNKRTNDAPGVAIDEATTAKLADVLSPRPSTAASAKTAEDATTVGLSHLFSPSTLPSSPSYFLSAGQSGHSALLTSPRITSPRPTRTPGSKRQFFQDPIPEDTVTRSATASSARRRGTPGLTPKGAGGQLSHPSSSRQSRLSGTSVTSSGEARETVTLLSVDRLKTKLRARRSQASSKEKELAASDDSEELSSAEEAGDDSGLDDAASVVAQHGGADARQGRPRTRESHQSYVPDEGLSDAAASHLDFAKGAQVVSLDDVVASDEASRARLLESELSVYPRLVHHWCMANNESRAVKLAEAAGQAALIRYALREVADAVILDDVSDRDSSKHGLESHRSWRDLDSRGSARRGSRPGSRDDETLLSGILRAAGLGDADAQHVFLSTLPWISGIASASAALDATSSSVTPRGAPSGAPSSGPPVVASVAAPLMPKKSFHTMRERLTSAGSARRDGRSEAKAASTDVDSPPKAVHLDATDWEAMQASGGASDEVGGKRDEVTGSVTTHDSGDTSDSGYDARSRGSPGPPDARLVRVGQQSPRTSLALLQSPLNFTRPTGRRSRLPSMDSDAASPSVQMSDVASTVGGSGSSGREGPAQAAWTSELQQSSGSRVGSSDHPGSQSTNAQSSGSTRSVVMGTPGSEPFDSLTDSGGRPVLSPVVSAAGVGQAPVVAVQARSPTGSHKRAAGGPLTRRVRGMRADGRRGSALSSLSVESSPASSASRLTVPTSIKSRPRDLNGSGSHTGSVSGSIDNSPAPDTPNRDRGFGISWVIARARAEDSAASSPIALSGGRRFGSAVSERDARDAAALDAYAATSSLSTPVPAKLNGSPRAQSPYVHASRPLRQHNILQQRQVRSMDFDAEEDALGQPRFAAAQRVRAASDARPRAASHSSRVAASMSMDAQLDLSGEDAAADVGLSPMRRGAGWLRARARKLLSQTD